MDDEDFLPSTLYWDSPHYFLNGQIFVPLIYDGIISKESIPSAFNTVKIVLDGTVFSTLDWKCAHEIASEYIQKNYKLFWEIDLGLFSQLSSPLQDQAQFSTLSLALEHFKETIWKKFFSHTVGASLYRGPADFSHVFVRTKMQMDHFKEWLEQNSSKNEELQEDKAYSLYCRDVAAEYLHCLRGFLPDDLQAFLLMDLDSNASLLQQARLVSKERFSPFHLAIRGGNLAPRELAWERASPFGIIAKDRKETFSFETPRVAVCLPREEEFREGSEKIFEMALQRLNAKQMAFKIVPEDLLLTEWEGIDYILFNSKFLSPSGRRQLQGFCAAGGTCVALATEIGLSEELTFEQFLNRV